MGLFRLTFRFNRRVFGDLTPNFDQSITMKIYEDVFSGDEMFSDTYPIKLVHDCLWEVTGKHISRTQDEIQLAGANASAEEADEGTDAASVFGERGRNKGPSRGVQKKYPNCHEGTFRKIQRSPILHRRVNGSKRNDFDGRIQGC